MKNKELNLSINGVDIKIDERENMSEWYKFGMSIRFANAPNGEDVEERVIRAIARELKDCPIEMCGTFLVKEEKNHEL